MALIWISNIDRPHRDSAGAVEIAVADTGPGIDLEITERLFQPFVTTKPHGMGVGPSICRALVEAHGGALRAEANPGGGTIEDALTQIKASKDHNR